MSWASLAAESLWQNAWAVIPLAILVAVMCRCLARRPATRHMLWLVVLLAFVAPLVLPELPAGMLPDLEAFSGNDAGGNGAVVLDHNEPVGSRSVSATPEPDPVPDAALAPFVHDGDPGLLALSRASGESATSPRAVAPTELRVPQRLPAVPGSVEPLFAHVADGEPVSESTRVTDGQDTAAAPVVVNSPAAEPKRDWWRPWLSGLLTVRDAVGRLPAMPVHIWIAGLGLLGLVQAGRVYAFHRCLRRAQPAPPSVAQSVNRVSYAYGLRRAPETLMVDGCVSPMIWCGRRTRLILPTRLWSQLDRVGRTAVICHELAHLRRRDHWVRWIEMIVSAVYWWHPVVWWARRRLHEESELCCDAWVTWLMPERRRAYAETLLRTKQFVGQGGGLVPAGGMGVTSVGARTLARRLTMIMTGSTRPRASATGIILASVLALAGWVTMPAWASPEDPDKDQNCKKKGVEVITIRAPKVTVLGGGGAVPTAPEIAIWPAAAAAPALVAFASPDGDDELQERLGHLEHELQALSRQLMELRVLAGGKRELKVLRTPPVRPVPPVPSEPSRPLIGIGRGGVVRGSLGRVYGGGGSNETVVRKYRLSKGKLEALTQLMVRQDVPVLVSPNEDYLEVRATARQHATFAAFVKLIHPSGGKARGGGGGGVAVPYRVEAYADALELYDDSSEHYNEAYKHYYDALKQIRKSKLSGQVRSQAGTALRKALRGRRRAGVSARAEQIPSANALLERVRSEAHGHERHAATMEAEAEHLQQQSEQLETEAEALLDHAADLAHSAEQLGAGDEARSLRKEAQGLERQAKQLERKARELEKRAREIERKAERTERDVDELDEGADELAAALDVLVTSAEHVEPVECADAPPEPEPKR